MPGKIRCRRGGKGGCEEQGAWRGIAGRRNCERPAGRGGRGSCPSDLNFIIAQNQNNLGIDSLADLDNIYQQTPGNKIIMKVSRQRNPYLKRIFSQQPHKYSYDIEKGKYYLLDQQGQTMLVNPNGTFRPKFTPNFSGFVDHKSRYKEAQADPALLHFAPDPHPHTSYHNPVPDKFSGYAQFPYQMTDGLPKYLRRPSEQPSPRYVRQKAQSLILGKEQKRQTNVSLLESTLSQRGAGQQFFNEAWEAMTETKPLPKQRKKTCYNYKCKFLKQWVFDERGKLEGRQVRVVDQTLGRSFHEGALAREMQESKLLSTMALTGVGG